MTGREASPPLSGFTTGGSSDSLEDESSFASAPSNLDEDDDDDQQFSSAHEWPHPSLPGTAYSRASVIAPDVVANSSQQVVGSSGVDHSAGTAMLDGQERTPADVVVDVAVLLDGQETVKELAIAAAAGTICVGASELAANERAGDSAASPQQQHWVCGPASESSGNNVDGVAAAAATCESVEAKADRHLVTPGAAAIGVVGSSGIDDESLARLIDVLVSCGMVEEEKAAAWSSFAGPILLKQMEAGTSNDEPAIEPASRPTPTPPMALLTDTRGDDGTLECSNQNRRWPPEAPDDDELHQSENSTNRARPGGGRDDSVLAAVATASRQQQGEASTSMRGLPKINSRYVGIYKQRSLPFRSASFSHVDREPPAGPSRVDAAVGVIEEDGALANPASVESGGDGTKSSSPTIGKRILRLFHLRPGSYGHQPPPGEWPRGGSRRGIGQQYEERNQLQQDGDDSNRTGNVKRLPTPTSASPSPSHRGDTGMQPIPMALAGQRDTAGVDSRRPSAAELTGLSPGTCWSASSWSQRPSPATAFLPRPSSALASRTTYSPTLSAGTGGGGGGTWPRNGIPTVCLPAVEPCCTSLSSGGTAARRHDSSSTSAAAAAAQLVTATSMTSIPVEPAGAACDRKLPSYHSHQRSLPAKLGLDLEDSLRAYVGRSGQQQQFDEATQATAAVLGAALAVDLSGHCGGPSTQATGGRGREEYDDDDDVVRGKCELDVALGHHVPGSVTLSTLSLDSAVGVLRTSASSDDDPVSGDYNPALLTNAGGRSLLNPHPYRQLSHDERSMLLAMGRPLTVLEDDRPNKAHPLLASSISTSPLERPANLRHSLAQSEPMVADVALLDNNKSQHRSVSVAAGHLLVPTRPPRSRKEGKAMPSAQQHNRQLYTLPSASLSATPAPRNDSEDYRTDDTDTNAPAPSARAGAVEPGREEPDENGLRVEEGLMVGTCTSVMHRSDSPGQPAPVTVNVMISSVGQTSPPVVHADGDCEEDVLERSTYCLRESPVLDQGVTRGAAEWDASCRGEPCPAVSPVSISMGGSDLRDPSDTVTGGAQPNTWDDNVGLPATIGGLLLMGDHQLDGASSSADMAVEDVLGDSDRNERSVLASASSTSWDEDNAAINSAGEYSRVGSTSGTCTTTGAGDDDCALAMVRGRATSLSTGEGRHRPRLSRQQAAVHRFCPPSMLNNREARSMTLSEDGSGPSSIISSPALSEHLGPTWIVRGCDPASSSSSSPPSPSAQWCQRPSSGRDGPAAPSAGGEVVSASTPSSNGSRRNEDDCSLLTAALAAERSTTTTTTTKAGAAAVAATGSSIYPAGMTSINSNCNSGGRRSPASPFGPPQRYYKRPPRGPYGEILEAEMSRDNKLSRRLTDELSNLLCNIAASSSASSGRGERSPVKGVLIGTDAGDSSSRPGSPGHLLPAVAREASFLDPGQVSRERRQHHELQRTLSMGGANDAVLSSSTTPASIVVPSSCSQPTASPPLARTFSSDGGPAVALLSGGASKKRHKSGLPYVASESDFDKLRTAHHCRVPSSPAKLPSMAMMDVAYYDDCQQQQPLSDDELVQHQRHQQQNRPMRDASSPVIVAGSWADNSSGGPTTLRRRLNHQRTESSPVHQATETISAVQAAHGDGTPSSQLQQQSRKASHRKRNLDTRTHVVGELFDTERSYVESLQIIVNKYLEPLKSPEGSETVHPQLVEEIFFRIPEILSHHETFLEELKQRVDSWDVAQKVGDVIVKTFAREEVISTYSAFINHWKLAREAVKLACQQKTAFERYINATARELRGRLAMDCALDSLLIMPVQRIPRYELLIKMLLKHTDSGHPDHADLVAAQREVHSLALKINHMEEETRQQERRDQALMAVQAMVDGLTLLPPVLPNSGSNVTASTAGLTSTSTSSAAAAHNSAVVASSSLAAPLQQHRYQHQLTSSSSAQTTTCSAGLSHGAGPSTMLTDPAGDECSGDKQESSSLAPISRAFLRYDLVSMPGSLGTKKERAVFLFTDLLVICSLKRRTGPVRKPDSVTPETLSALDGAKYKLLMRIPLENLEMTKAKDENLKKILREVAHLEEDLRTIQLLQDAAHSLHSPHSDLDNLLRDMGTSTAKQVAEKQLGDSQLLCTDLTVATRDGFENVSITFLTPEKRAVWEEVFLDAKQQHGSSSSSSAISKQLLPDFMYPLPIRKTRAGLQFTCAAPTLGLNAHGLRDVWVCNSDGYVGQVCILSLLSLDDPPTVQSCNGVCNSRILCIASVPTADAVIDSSSSAESERAQQQQRQLGRAAAPKSAADGELPGEVAVMSSVDFAAGEDSMRVDDAAAGVALISSPPSIRPLDYPDEEGKPPPSLVLSSVASDERVMETIGGLQGAGQQVVHLELDSSDDSSSSSSSSVSDEEDEGFADENSKRQARHSTLLAGEQQLMDQHQQGEGTDSTEATKASSSLLCTGAPAEFADGAAGIKGGVDGTLLQQHASMRTAAAAVAGGPHSIRGGSLPPEPSAYAHQQQLTSGHGGGNGSATLAWPPASSDEGDTLQPTMWIGTEDGTIHVYNCSDNIRMKKNKIKIQHGSAVQAIQYFDDKVFVALAEGTISVYSRDRTTCAWNINDPDVVHVDASVCKLATVGRNKLWCGCLNRIRIINTTTLEIEGSITVDGDSSRGVACLAASGYGVWVALHGSSMVRLYHALSYELLGEVNAGPAVAKMLSCCDDIIRQHKAACLRVTALLCCEDLLWVGTSAGVILVVPLPQITEKTRTLQHPLEIIGLPMGHTGHVRFLMAVEPAPQAECGDACVAAGGRGGPHPHQGLVVSSSNKHHRRLSSSNKPPALIVKGYARVHHQRSSSHGQHHPYCLSPDNIKGPNSALRDHSSPAAAAAGDHSSRRGCPRTPPPPPPSAAGKMGRRTIDIPSTSGSSSFMMVVSGGDGFEDFWTGSSSGDEGAGRDDSTNHLMIWRA